MPRPPIKPVEDKLRIVLAVLRGEVSIKEVARRERVSATATAARRAHFLGGGGRVVGGRRGGPGGRCPPRPKRPRGRAPGPGRGAHQRPRRGPRGAARVAKRGGVLPGFEHLAGTR